MLPQTFTASERAVLAEGGEKKEVLPLRCGGSGQADRVHSEEAKMINRKFKRMVSVFLCFAVAAGLVPLSAAAVEKQPEIVSELTEMRDEYQKHFLTSDGTVAAAV